MPVGFAGGLPIGIQFAGRRDTDEILISVATAYQAATGHHLTIPPSRQE